MYRIKENLLLPIVLQVTQVPLGLYGRTDKAATKCSPEFFGEHKNVIYTYLNVCTQILSFFTLFQWYNIWLLGINYESDVMII
jgi:hypothetical protein